MHLSYPHTCYMPHRFNSSRFDHPNNIGLGVRIIKLFIMSFSPLSCYLVPLRPKYSSQHPILKHPKPTSSLHTRNTRKFLPRFFGSFSWFYSSATIVTQLRAVGLLDLREGVRFFLSHSLIGQGRAESEPKRWSSIWSVHYRTYPPENSHTEISFVVQCPLTVIKPCC